MAALALRGFAINEILRRHTVHYRCERVAMDSRDLHWLERFPRVLFSVGSFFSGWLALFRWLGINTLHYFGERHWSAYLIALLTMMAVIIVWLNPRCFLSLLFFSEKKWSTQRKSERCRTILNHFIKSTFKWMCTFFRYTLRKNNFSLKKTYNKPSTC